MDTFEQMNSVVGKYRANFQSYCDYATRLMDLVTQLIGQSGAKVHFVQSRAKTPECFAEKISRPGKQYQDPLGEVPDIVGVRVVLYYSDSVKNVGDLVKREFDVIEEVVGHQPTAYGVDQFGYLSMHYVVKLHPKRKDLPEWQNWSAVRAEIQVRTVLQHSWAAVSHALHYKREGDVPEKLRRRMHRLAGLFELADEEFVGIRDEAVEISKLTSDELRSNPNSVRVDAQSLTHFLLNSELFKRLHDQAVSLGYSFDPPIGFFGEWDETDYLAKAVETLLRLGVSVLSEINDLLSFDAEAFLKKIKINDWYITDSLLFILLLVGARPKAFTVKGLVAGGFSKPLATRILAGAKLINQSGTAAEV